MAFPSDSNNVGLAHNRHGSLDLDLDNSRQEPEANHSEDMQESAPGDACRYISKTGLHNKRSTL